MPLHYDNAFWHPASDRPHKLCTLRRLTPSMRISKVCKSPMNRIMGHDCGRKRQWALDDQVPTALVLRKRLYQSKSPRAQQPFSARPDVVRGFRLRTYWSKSPRVRLQRLGKMLAQVLVEEKAIMHESEGNQMYRQQSKGSGL